MDILNTKLNTEVNDKFYWTQNSILWLIYQESITYKIEKLKKLINTLKV